MPYLKRLLMLAVSQEALLLAIPQEVIATVKRVLLLVVPHVVVDVVGTSRGYC